MHWLGPIPTIRHERHFGDRVVRAFDRRPAGVAAMLAEAVARHPTGEALVEGPRRLDWRTVEDQVARLAGGLAGLGVGRGDRVAILGANSVEHVLTLHAACRLGAVAVPLNIRESRPGLAWMLAHSGATALVHDAALSHLVPDAPDVPALRHRAVIGRTQGSGPPTAAVAFDALALAAPVAPAPVAEEDVAAILYTSGTTGRPKGAMITHLGLVHAAMIYEACMGLSAADRSVVSVPLSHVTGLTAAVMAMLRAAGTLVVSPPFRADGCVALAAVERMTHTVMVPAQYNLILMSPALAGADLSAWRVGGYGGAPMPEATIRRLAGRLPGLSLMNAYGSTETTGPVVLMPPAQSLARRTAVGRAVPVAEILVVDDDGREVPAGCMGEVWLRAPNVVAGYWNDPVATAEGVVAGFWRSGDLGSLDADGYLTLLDRKKDMINRAGFKVFSAEVENVLAAHPAVAEVAVVARPCPVLGERVHAFVVPREPATPIDTVALQRHCAAELANYKVPETFTMLAEPLPRNANGKVQKRDLRERVAAAG